MLQYIWIANYIYTRKKNNKLFNLLTTQQQQQQEHITMMMLIMYLINNLEASGPQNKTKRIKIYLFITHLYLDVVISYKF